MWAYEWGKVLLNWLLPLAAVKCFVCFCFLLLWLLLITIAAAAIVVAAAAAAAAVFIFFSFVDVGQQLLGHDLWFSLISSVVRFVHVSGFLTVFLLYFYFFFCFIFHTLIRGYVRCYVCYDLYVLTITAAFYWILFFVFVIEIYIWNYFVKKSKTKVKTLKMLYWINFFLRQQKPSASAVFSFI